MAYTEQLYKNNTKLTVSLLTFCNAESPTIDRAIPGRTIPAPPGMDDGERANAGSGGT